MWSTIHEVKYLKNCVNLINESIHLHCRSPQDMTETMTPTPRTSLWVKSVHLSGLAGLPPSQVSSQHQARMAHPSWPPMNKIHPTTAQVTSSITLVTAPTSLLHLSTRILPRTASMRTGPGIKCCGQEVRPHSWSVLGTNMSQTTASIPMVLSVALAQRLMTTICRQDWTQGQSTHNNNLLHLLSTFNG